MQNIFSDSGLSLTYYVEISATFLLTMLMFFDRKAYGKHKWVHHLCFIVLTFWWILALVFETLATKMYATLMLISVVVVETAIRRKRRNLP